ncbi:MAG: hypothetical protein ABJK40_11125, partial [Ilumatobacter sp.]
MKFPHVLTTVGLVVSTLVGVAVVTQPGATTQAAPPILEIDVRAVAEVPDDATAAVLNIAAARAQQPGYVVAWPCDQPQPATSSLNYRPGAPISNSTIVTLSATGTVCMSRSNDVDLIVDINSVFGSGGAFVGQNPERLLDTRNAQPLAAGQTLAVDVGGRGSIPVDASAAVLNIAAARASQAGYLVAWPCGGPKPSTAALNYSTGPAVSNTTAVALGTNGQVCLESSAPTDVVIDANGSFAASGEAPFDPQRLVDTRLERRVAAGTVLEVQISGHPGVPSDATAAAINIAAVRPAARGYVVAWPCGGNQPATASLNYEDRPVSNTTIIGLGTGGRVCMSASTDVDLVVDLNGAYPASANITSFTPLRLVDTRTSTPAAPGGSNPEPSPRPTGPGWIETFDTAAALDRIDVQVHHRSDHDPDVNYPAQPNQRLGTNTWTGDHGLDCGPPTQGRTLSAQDRASNTYMCREHFMTSMGDVDGYSTIAFSPKQVFPSVHEVCWDQNVTNMGGRQWTEVVITPNNAIRVQDGKQYIAHTGPGTTGVDNTGSLHAPQTFGIKLAGPFDGLSIWQNGGRADNDPYYAYADTEGMESVAIRRQHCITDLGNGTIEVRIDQGTSTYVRQVPGTFPRNARVIFEDHNYTP